LKSRLCKVIFVCFSFTTVVSASDIFSNARQYGLGGAYSAMVQGAEATFSNPANLYLNPKQKFSMNLLGLGAELSNNAISHSSYQRYVGDYLDDQEIDDMLSLIPADGVNLRSDAKLQGIGIAYGPVSFGIRGFSSYSSIFARELFELALKGNELDRIYSFSPVSGEGMSVAAAGLGLGHSFTFSESVVKNFAFGVTLSYLYGLSFTRVSESDFYTETTFTDIEGDGSLVAEYAEGGDGYAVNLGTTIALFNDIRASVVLQNVTSLMEWDKNAKNILFHFNINENGLEPLLDAGSPIDSVFVTQDTSIAVSKFTSRLPSVLRLAMMIPLRTSLSLNTEYEQGFDDSAISSTKPRFAMGAEFRPNRVLRFRVGASIGGSYENHYSGGFGLAIDRFCWDIAVRSYNGLTSKTSKGFGLATSIGIRY
jgi:hypothetical protein